MCREHATFFSPILLGSLLVVILLVVLGVVTGLIR